MYQPQHFRIEELVPPDMHTRWRHAPQRLLMLFDIAALQTLDALRRRYGPIIINNWHAGGAFSLSGWRPWNSTEGAALSQHKMGRAFDCKFLRVTADEVREELMRTPHAPVFSAIRRIEAFEGMSWFHFDTGNHDTTEKGILVMGDGIHPVPPQTRAQPMQESPATLGGNA